MRYLSSKKSGFTLVEMVISLGIFSIVAVVALGALVKIITANRKAQTLQSSLTNLNFAMESMARELRVGDTYQCDTSMGVYDGPTLSVRGCYLNNDVVGNVNYRTDSVIAFKSNRRYTPGNCNLATAYQFVGVAGDYRLKKGEQLVCSDPSTGPATSEADKLKVENMQDILDNSNIKLTGYRLSVGPYNGSTLSSVYPYVYIRLMGYSGLRERDRTYFDISTMVSSRLPQR